MSYAGNQAARVLIAASFASSLLLAALASMPVGATTSNVAATICDTKIASLALTAPLDGSIFDGPDVTIEGSVYRISQIQVYMDGNALDMRALDAGATSFSYATTLSVGRHTLRFVGIDPCSSSNPEANITLTYKPGAAPTPQPTPAGQPPQPLTTAIGHAQKAGGEAIDYMQKQVDEASQSPPASSLSDTLYRALVAVDLAPKAATSQEVDRMVNRAVLVMAGAACIVAASPIITAYHTVRYRMLKWNVHALPELVQHHAILTLRLFGGALILATFLLLG